MKTLIIVALSLAATVIVAVIGGSVWWSLWMNRGWPGSPGLLKRILGADGEGAYDAMQLEMTLIVWIIVAAISLAAYAARRSGLSS